MWAYLRELKEKIVRDPLPPKAVAAGWALGMFVGCLVPFGLQLLVSVPLAFKLHVSKVGATLGTLITNPVTILFIYPAQTWAGSRLLGSPLSWEYIKDACGRISHVSLFNSAGWSTLAEIGGVVLGGFFLGGLLIALVMTPITYVIVNRIVVRFRRRSDYSLKTNKCNLNT